MISDTVRKLADEAKRKGLWLYDPAFKKWYSPEEFTHIFSYANATDEFLKGLQLRHPSEGIEAGFKKLREVQDKLFTFYNTVMQYYRK